MIRFVAGSTVKMQQLLGETDKEKHQPTLSLTETRYGIRGTDLGNSFEHNGRVYFLFGDTVGRLDRALDTIATTDATDPEQGVRLDFLMAGRDYLTIQPPGTSMGAFEVPVAGVSLGGGVLGGAVSAPDPPPPQGRIEARTVAVLQPVFTLPATFVSAPAYNLSTSCRAGVNISPLPPRLASVDRSQLLLHSIDVERLIEEDHCARAIWELIGRLDLSLYNAEIAAVEGHAGRDHTAPQLLISLWLYAYSQGISSAREVARRSAFEPGFQWLCGLKAISHRTLSGFRSDHKEALDNLFVQVVGMLSAEGLITMQDASSRCPCTPNRDRLRACPRADPSSLSGARGFTARATLIFPSSQ